MDTCDLREANGLPDEHCDGSACVFWRAIEQAGIEPGEGCAIRHYQLLGDERVAAWLLSVKERTDRVREAARTTECADGDAS